MPKVSKDDPSYKNLYVLLIVSLLLSLLYVIFAQTIIGFTPGKIADTGLSILIACMPLLILSAVESYTLTKIFKIKNTERYVSAFIFCLFYIVTASVNVAVLVASGALA
jgi:hypothetical protein